MPNNEIVPFAFDGGEVRVVVIDSEPWFVATDIARALGYRDANRITSRLEADEKGTHSVGTLGGTQSLAIISESGMFTAILRSESAAAAPFRRKVTGEILPAIRKTGTYSAVRKSPMEIIREQHQSIGILLEENENLTVRAVQAETTIDIIEGSEGLSVREFHKQYFSETSERDFNDLLYRKRLLIDQRGTRGRDAHGRLKNGKEHRHPTWIGKPFFYLDPTVDRETGERHYQTKVRPGTPEVELIRFLEAAGLRANRNIDRALKAVTA